MIKKLYQKHRRKNRLIFICLLVLLSILSVLALTLGNTNYDIATVMRVLNGETIKGATFAIKTL